MFGEISDEFFNEFWKIEEIFERLFEETKYPTRLGGDNLYYGVSVYVGPDGKPVVKEYGNFNPQIKKSLIESGKKEPYVDIEEKEKELTITAEIPGVQKEDIEIKATEETVEINTERKDDKKGADHVLEKDYKEYQGTYGLPSLVNPNKAKARYKNGVLEITLPKAEVNKATMVEAE